MEQMSVETYLKNMKLRNKAFGGCDPEDVAQKMNELIKLSRKEGANEEAARARMASEASGKELAGLRSENKRMTEALVAQARSSKAALEDERNKRLAAESRLERLENELRAAKGSTAERSDAERLSSLLASLESDKADIIAQYTLKAQKDAQEAALKNAQLRHTNEQLQNLVNAETKALSAKADEFLMQLQQMKLQIAELGRGNG